MADPMCEFCRASDCRSVTAAPGDRLVEALNCARRRVEVLEAAGDELAAVASEEEDMHPCPPLMDAAERWTKARGQ